ncbi:UDP-2,3-diacylglucosamine diphosphatase [Salibacter halophilus]|uniref:UDP-2,3-diacylglucosamine diphosphatase n=2 Tax=Salibacter halophilus TaxID=1803916 RepID=A0A6N6M4B0_9FLAO|nr:UDP-2,3-diacylglucosamine diphosphatase [Salibacter halophilus]
MMNLEPGKKIYFASDQHFGAPNPAESKKRETHFIQWLDKIKNDCQILYLVGDLFDFWFEYKTVVPRGHVRLLGKLAELSDSGIKIHFFTGNHDMWVFDYLPEEIGMELHHEPIEREYNGKQFYIGHGDGLGPGDHGYKFIKKVFRNKLCQWLFARLHPNFGIGLANYFSKSSRAATGDNDKTYLGEENEWLAIYAKEKLQEKHYDYFVFGHRHLPLDLTVGENSRYINLGDWISDFTYAIFDGSELTLEECPFKK